MNRQLYSYWRSSAAYRVRIGLNLKALVYETRHVSLVDGEQQSAEFLEVNAQGLVPVLKEGEVTLGQSLAILEYLEETYPENPLLPSDPVMRAKARQIAGMIACDIHPLCNLRVLKYLQQEFAVSDDGKMQRYRHWVRQGLEAGNAQIEPTRGRYCVGDSPTLADICLIPQLYNANRFDVSLTGLDALLHIADHCQALDAFIEAAPERHSPA